jgi:predicted HTH transcriptional regulator
MPDKPAKEGFINPTGRYQGDFTPGNLAFDANLQEFTNRVSIICALENGGKITPAEAYEQIKNLWAELKASKRNLLDG